MAQEIKQLQLTNTGNGILLNWTAPEGLVFGYSVYRGISDDDDYSQITNTLLTNNFYLDLTAYQNQRTDYWYKVSATDAFGEGLLSKGITNINFSRRSKPSELNPIWRGAEPDISRICSEWTRRNEIILRRDGAFCDCWILKTSGPKCPNCYEPTRQQPGFDNCPVCFGTSYQGGYDVFKSVLIKIEPYSDSRMLSEAGFKQTEIPRSWCSPYPPLKPGDVVVRKANNFRYEVQSAGPKIISEIVIRQEFDLIQIQRAENPGIFLLDAS